MIQQSKLHCYIYFVNLFFYDLSRVFMRGVDLCHAFFNCVRISGKGAEIGIKSIIIRTCSLILSKGGGFN